MILQVTEISNDAQEIKCVEQRDLKATCQNGRTISESLRKWQNLKGLWSSVARTLAAEKRWEGPSLVTSCNHWNVTRERSFWCFNRFWCSFSSLSGQQKPQQIFSPLLSVCVTSCHHSECWCVTVESLYKSSMSSRSSVRRDVDVCVRWQLIGCHQLLSVHLYVYMSPP